LGKLKDILHTITEMHTERKQGIGEGADLRKQRTQFPKRLAPILDP
jgi:hypothetical protein